MASITVPQQRIDLLKKVERLFEKDGWTVEKRRDESCDFFVGADSLTFLVKCLDETRIVYDSPTKIVTRLESYARELRNLRNRQLIVVLDRNFLGLPLDNLLERQIFALTLDELPLVSELARYRQSFPTGLDTRQTYLVEHCLTYTIFVSTLHQKAERWPEAIAWGRRATELGVGYTNALPHLFNLLKAAKQFDTAEEIGQKIMQFRPDDPQSIKRMAELARKRGDQAGTARWMAHLTERQTAPRTLQDILSKQREQSGQTNPRKDVPAGAESPSPRSGLARLFAGFGRRTRD